MKSDWQKIKLGDILTLQSGYAFSSKKFTQEDGLPLIRIRDIKNGLKTQVNYNGAFEPKYLVKKGDLLVGMDGEFRCYEWKGQQALLNQRVCKLIDFKGIHPKFLLYGINKYLKEIEDVTTFTTVKHISAKKIKDIEFPLPSEIVQKKIVSKLDQAFEAIDQAIANTEKNIENVEELLKSSINRLISNVSSNYIEMNLNDLTTKIGSGATPKGGKSSYKLEGISLIRSMNVHDLRFKKKDLAFIDEYQAEKLNNVTLEKGDVLLNITGASISRTCIVPAEVLPARVNQHVSIIRAKKDLIRPAFLNLMLYSQRYKNEILGIGEKGATRQAITKGQLESLNVKFPSSLDKQDILIEKANYLLEKTRVLKDSYDKKLINLIELKMSILEKAFNGELV